MNVAFVIMVSEVATLKQTKMTSCTHVLVLGGYKIKTMMTNVVFFIVVSKLATLKKNTMTTSYTQIVMVLEVATMKKLNMMSYNSLS